MSEDNVNEMLRTPKAVDPTASETTPGENLAKSLGLSDREFENAIKLISSMADEYFEQSVTTDYAEKVLVALYDVGFEYAPEYGNKYAIGTAIKLKALEGQRNNLLSHHTFLFRLFKDTLTHHREHFQHILKVTDGIEELIEGLSPSQLKGFLHLIRSQCDRSISNIDNLKKIELGKLYVGENYDDSTPQ